MNLNGDWDKTELGNICNLQYGYTTSSISSNTGVKFLRITDIRENKVLKWENVPYAKINEDKLEKYSIKNNDILIARIGSTTGKTCIIKKPPRSIFASYLIRATVKDEEKVDPNFVYYFTLSNNYWSQVNAGKEDKLKKGVSLSLLTKLSLPLPPLPEQKKIAAVLSAVQEAKEKTETVIEATKTLKKSMMKHLFTYGPVSVKEADKVDTVNFEIGEIPSSWKTAKIEEFYNFSRKPKNLDIAANEELPFIPMEGISNKSKSYSWIKKIKSNISSGTFVFKNDLIVAKITPSFENGKQSILYNLPNEYGYATTEVWALHSKDESSLNEYLYEYLKLPTVRKEIAGKMEGSTGRQRVSRGVISNTMFPKPTLKEQRDIVNILDKIDTKIKSEENKKQALEKLFQSLLKNLMTGKLRVNDIDIKH